MELELTMHPIAWDRDGRVYESGSPISYVIENPLPGEEAYLNKSNDGWRIIREKGSIRTESPVNYASEHDALAALQRQYSWEL